MVPGGKLSKITYIEQLLKANINRKINPGTTPEGTTPGKKR